MLGENTLRKNCCLFLATPPGGYGRTPSPHLSVPIGRLVLQPNLSRLRLHALGGYSSSRPTLRTSRNVRLGKAGFFPRSYSKIAHFSRKIVTRSMQMSFRKMHGILKQVLPQPKTLSSLSEDEEKQINKQTNIVWLTKRQRLRCVTRISGVSVKSDFTHKHNILAHIYKRATAPPSRTCKPHTPRSQAFFQLVQPVQRQSFCRAIPNQFAGYPVNEVFRRFPRSLTL